MTNAIDRAWEIIQTFLPNLTLKSFLQKLQPIIEANKHLSREEIKKKLLEYIKQEKPFGEALAQGADYVLEAKPSEEESVAGVCEYFEQVEATETTKEVSQANSAQGQQVI
jgi:hypothetical protein